jgi:hypothetical protein
MPIGINGHVWAGARTAVYRSPFLWLNGAASLIARHLASTNPTKYPDEASALDSARRQLVQALFDGAVYSEGVRWWGDPGAEDPSKPPPIPEPDEWQKIDIGWWSHERYEQYVVRYQQTKLEFLLLRPEGSTEEWVPKLPVEQVFERTNVLDKIIVSWDANAFDFQGFEGDQGYSRIRVRRDDIKAQFGSEEAELQATEIGTPTDAAPPVKREPPKRGRRPADVRTSVYEWLDGQSEGSRMCDRPHTELAHCYCTEIVKPKDELGLRKCVDTIRKQVTNWCREHHSRKS